MAETICTALESRGQSCWFGARDIHPGENFQESIVRAIRAAKVMVFVFSANSNNSDEVKKEIVLASQHKLFVIPVRVEDVTPNEAFAYEFATRQWIDLFSDWETSLDQLCMQIDAITAMQTPGDGEAPAADAPKRTTRRPAADAPVAAAVVPPPIAPAVDVDALFEQGNNYAKAGQYDQAIEQYDQVIKAKPDHANALNNRGNALQAKGSYDMAIADFDRAIQVKPDFAAAYCNRGNAYQAKGDLDPAVRDYTVALQLKPDFVVALENRARAYERKGIHDMARKDRAAAAQLKAGATPQHAPGPVPVGQQPLGAPPSPAVTASNNRMILIIGGVVLGALLLIAIIVSAIQGMHPSNSSSQVALNSSASSALSSTSSTAISSNPVDTASIADANNRGDAAFKAGDYVGAMQAYMIAANQGDSSAEYNVGWLYDNGDGVAQDYSQALHWYTLAANQGDSSAQNNLGELYYYGHGVAVDYTAAAHWYMLSAAQGEPNAEYSLGWLYAHGQGVTQDTAEARIWMVKSAMQGKEDAKTWLAQNPE